MNHANDDDHCRRGPVVNNVLFYEETPKAPLSVENLHT